MAEILIAESSREIVFRMGQSEGCSSSDCVFPKAKKVWLVWHCVIEATFQAANERLTAQIQPQKYIYFFLKKTPVWGWGNEGKHLCRQIRSGQIKRLEWWMRGLSTRRGTWNIAMFYGRSQLGRTHLRQMCGLGWESFTRASWNTMTNNENAMYVFFPPIYLFIWTSYILKMYLWVFMTSVSLLPPPPPMLFLNEDKINVSSFSRRKGVSLFNAPGFIQCTDSRLPSRGTLVSWEMKSQIPTSIQDLFFFLHPGKGASAVHPNNHHNGTSSVWAATHPGSEVETPSNSQRDRSFS